MQCFRAPFHSIKPSPAAPVLDGTSNPFWIYSASRSRESESCLLTDRKIWAKAKGESSFLLLCLPPPPQIRQARFESLGHAIPRPLSHTESPRAETQSHPLPLAIGQAPWDQANHPAYPTPQILFELPPLPPPSTKPCNSTAPKANTTFPGKLKKPAYPPASFVQPSLRPHQPTTAPRIRKLKKFPQPKCLPHSSSTTVDWPPRPDDNPCGKDPPRAIPCQTHAPREYLKAPHSPWPTHRSPELVMPLSPYESDLRTA